MGLHASGHHILNIFLSLEGGRVFRNLHLRGAKAEEMEKSWLVTPLHRFFSLQQRKNALGPYRCCAYYRQSSVSGF